VIKNKSKYALSWRRLVHSHTFRLSGPTVKTDRWIVLRYFIRALRKTWSAVDNGAVKSSDSEVVFYAQFPSQWEEMSSYIEPVLKKPVGLALYRDDLSVQGHPVTKFFHSLLLTVAAFVLFVVGWFNREHRPIAGLFLLQWTENTWLIFHLKKAGVRRFYLFGGYENDSGLTTLFCEAVNAEVYMVPSANPISNFYQVVVTHGFVFSAPFQREEYEKMKHNWMVNETVSWPFKGFQLLDPYLKQPETEPTRKAIAFMSRGIWLRKKKGANAWGSDFAYEEHCLDVLRQFLSKHPDWTLWILPHPIERREQNQSDTVAFYTQFFSGLSVKFPEPLDTPSYAFFKHAEIAFASVSSVNIERLYCGFKTLYGPIGAKQPLFGIALSPALRKICCTCWSRFQS
jgi:hypothetical protein